MDEPDSTYAPQSPDLSAFHPSYTPEQSSHSYYPEQQPSYPAPYLQSNSYVDPDPFGARITPPPQSTPYPPSAMSKNGRTRGGVDDGEWTPEASNRSGGRRSKKQKVEEDCGKLAPGVEEGIEVKTKFPVARIKRIMQADEDVGKVAQVTPTAVSKALELFMISVVTKAANEARAKSSKRVTAAHLKQAVAKDEQLDFLAEIIAKVPDAPAPKKEEDSEEIAEGKKKRGGTRRKRQEADDS